MKRRYRAVLLGYYGFGNLGDELLLQACIEMLCRCGLVREQIAVLSNNPGMTSRNFGVHSVNRWKFGHVVKVLRESDTMILAGGGIFQDSTSLKSCAWYWGMVRLARLLGVKVFAIGQSVGPLNSSISRIFAGDALRLCGKIHVRDKKSFLLAKTLGCENVIEGSDIVMTLKPEIPPVKRKYILVNLRPCSDLERWREILRGHVDSDTIGVALGDGDEEALKPLGLREIVRPGTFSEACGLWAGAKSAVGMRLHFGVLSRIMRVPLAMMPYDVKVNEFAIQSGVPCISGEWEEPVMPREIPESVNDVEGLCREIIGL
ncbi:MAG: polysaccharide pyruvyl transferase CsaB [Synergistaceae bacterium]|nr:polysaccharide pyruvyl transferase CsaB [Synergistaceae bacterium]